MFRVRLVALAAAVCLWAPGAEARASDAVLVFAASSMTSALDDMRPDLERAAGATVRISYASSATLARQIEAGAPADLFISADVDWMRYLMDLKLVRRGSSVTIAFNRLVLIAPAKSSVVLTVGHGFALRDALGGRRLAVGDPSSVPAGRYARAALEHLGVWDTVKDRLAPGENVRVALLFVARGECPLGIVYRSDAAAEPSVRIVDTFPDTSHPVITYPAGLTTVRSNPASTRVLAWLQTAEARHALARHGFVVERPRQP